MADEIDIYPAIVNEDADYVDRRVTAVIPPGTTTLSLNDTVCKRCGCPVADRRLHNEWHAAVRRAIANANMMGPIA